MNLFLMGNNQSYPLQLPGLAIYLNPDDPRTLTKDGSDLVEAIENAGSAADALQATANRKPKYVAGGINGQAGALEFRHDGSNASYMTISDSSDLNYSAFELVWQMQRVTDTGGDEIVLGKGVASGNQREFFAQVNGADRQEIFASSDGTSGGSSTDEGLNSLLAGVAVIMHMRYDGTTITWTVNKQTANQASLTLSPYQGTGPFVMGALDETVRAYAGRIGKVVFCTSAWNEGVRNDMLQWMADDVGITI